MSTTAEIPANPRLIAKLQGSIAANEGVPHGANPYGTADFFQQLSWSHGWLKQRVSMEERCVLIIDGEAL